MTQWQQSLLQCGTGWESDHIWIWWPTRYHRKALTMCLFIIAALSPEKKNENLSSNMSECSQIFKSQARISSLTFTLVGPVISLSSRIGIHCLNLTCRNSAEVWVLLLLIMPSSRRSHQLLAALQTVESRKSFTVIALPDLLSAPARWNHLLGYLDC